MILLMQVKTCCETVKGDDLSLEGVSTCKLQRHVENEEDPKMCPFDREKQPSRYGSCSFIFVDERVCLSDW